MRSKDNANKKLDVSVCHGGRVLNCAIIQHDFYTNSELSMIQKHTPEGWVVLTYQSIDEKPCYVVFCSWRQGDAWRLSSGSTVLPHLSPCGKYWIWPQISGSMYELPIDGENGYTYYTGTVLENLLKEPYSDGTMLKRIAFETIMETD